MNHDIKLFHGDCLELMKTIPEHSVDMILCDLPYGTTDCKWDNIIPFEPLWEQYERIIKDNGAIVLFGSEPFTSELVHSNIKNYKHHWVWIKEKGTGFQAAKYRPMMRTEDIIMFSKKPTTYNPQMILRDKPIKYKYPTIKSKSNPVANYNDKTVISNFKYPENILIFKTERGLHPTQKPVALLEYLINTYSNEGELVLDNTAGSMSTAIAAINTKRKCICIEKDDEYFKIGSERVEKRLKEIKEDLFNGP